MEVRIVPFTEAETEIRSIRDQVFGSEQGVPRDIDWDGEDCFCTHALAMQDATTPVGTGRLQRDGKIGRMAVLPAWRGRGTGGLILTALLEAARHQGLDQVYLHAQLRAVSFYRSYGFQPEGPEFTEADLQHIRMTRTIAERS
ncbi:Predicted N-acyltransferase, GNAT family [Alkalispirochaeta americana]|uniref:Predicted N-acyltransferase, GNAT family n=1 Tax=Alkalispirochaeta americana TaxID=159291 RepID=A0A1N6SZK2_9SPIO|nr:GNAT family N-acetyltransferase [Alkalispirochaeta americana]SIQ46568.1 Predicted N-acyltransferase, GNAT family [Alkalispirochaeta americana]